MRPVGYGRPGTEVFPDDWQDDHAAVFAGTLECTVTIGPTTAGAGTFQDADGQTHTTAGTAIYTGPASISVVTDTSRVVQTAEDRVPLRRYDVRLPVDTAGIDPEAHSVRVTASPDAMLTGRTLSIESVQRGGRRFTRSLITTLND